MKVYESIIKEKSLHPEEYIDKIVTLLMKISGGRRYGDVKGFFSKLWRSKDIDMNFYEALVEVLYNEENLKFDALKNILMPFKDYPSSALDDIIEFLEDF
jgi:hypothetical protein